MFKSCYALLLLCLLPAATRSDTFVSEEIITDPTPSRFSICHGYTCDHVSQTRLTASQWRRIRDIFSATYRSAREERERIRQAVAVLETMTGELIGTSSDKPKNYDGMRLELVTQMDCIDESTNTTTYLMMMQRDGLLRYHRVEDRQTRGFFIFGLPHTTAVISETRTGRQYVVDSWFEANGKPPHVLPVEKWSDGWDPADEKP